MNTYLKAILGKAVDERSYLEDLIVEAEELGARSIAVDMAARDLAILEAYEKNGSPKLLNKIQRKLEKAEEKNSDGWDAFIEMHEYITRLIQRASKLG